MESNKVLHIVMFPWLAMGHLRPFLHMSKILAQKGHKISFVSTPRNIQRLPKLPADLVPLINFVTLPLPKVDNLSPHEESSMDIPNSKYQFLKIAFDLLKPDLATFLQNSRPKPDWILYDYVSHWLPSLAADIGISTSYFCLFSAASMSFLGAPSFLMSGDDGRLTVEDYTVVPKWVPFPSSIAYQFHEVMRNVNGESGMESGTPDPVRFGGSIGGCDLVLIRTSVEFEPEWFSLVCEIYQKPVVPIGLLPQSSSATDSDDGCVENPGFIKNWLDMQGVNSVVYVALGSEAVLIHEELEELAHGLEHCGLPFIWVIREAAWSSLLPKGFVERVRNRGIVHAGWVQQVKILSHWAVGGFFTHCGWNSVIEGLGFGRVLILLPVMNEQGLNARLMKEKKVGVEIQRNEKDGSFTRDSVADSLRIAMEGEEGEALRARAREMKEVFGSGMRNDKYIDNVVTQLVNIRASHLMSDKKF